MAISKLKSFFQRLSSSSVGGPLIVAFVVWLAAIIWEHLNPSVIVHWLHGVTADEFQKFKAEEFQKLKETAATKEEVESLKVEFQKFKAEDFQKLKETAATKEEVEPMKADIKKAKADIAGLRSDIEGIKQKLTQSQADISGLKKADETINAKINGVDGKFTALDLGNAKHGQFIMLRNLHSKRSLKDGGDAGINAVGGGETRDMKWEILGLQRTD